MPHEAPPVKDDYNYPVGPVTRHKIALTNDFQQAGERYLSLSKVDRDHLVDNIVDSLCHAEKSIQKRMEDNLMKANQELGNRVATGLKLE
jgi:catalase